MNIWSKEKKSKQLQINKSQDRNKFLNHLQTKMMLTQLKFKNKMILLKY
jgi:hypothetical protein